MVIRNVGPVRRSPGPFAHAPFRWLVAARTTSLLGNGIAPIALAFAVLDLTGSATDLGLVLASRSVATVVLLLVGGVIADRLPRQLVLAGSSVLAALSQAAVATLVLTGTATIPLLAALSVVNGATGAVIFPASSALTPDTVPAPLLQRANVVLRLGNNGAMILGAAAGGVLVAAVGPGWGLVVDAAGFLLAAGFASRVRVDARDREPGTSVLTDLRDGWREFSRRRWVWIVVAQFSVVNAAFIGATTVLGPLVADRSFGRTAWGVVVAAESVGLVLGGLLTLAWRPRRMLAVGVACTLVSAAPALALGLQPPFVVVAAAGLLAGMAIEIFAVAWDMSLQQHIPSDRLARVYAYDALGSLIAVPVGEALVGPLAQSVGLAATLVGCAIAITAATLGALASRSVRGLVRVS
jgi:predicted MFS family arabinose efflux permease